jgi:hypothetical protein
MQTIHDPTLAAEIRKAIKIDVERYNLYHDGPIRTGAIIVVQQTLKVPLSMVVEGIVGEKQFRMGSVVYSYGDTPGDINYGLNGENVPRDAKMITVVMRYDPSPARGTVDAYSAWDGELAFKNIPIKEEIVATTSHQ